MKRLSKPCREWPRKKNGRGYGVRMVNGKMKQVHRLEWERHHGPIPQTDEYPYTMCVCHHCDNPACYEISHLFLGTVADNNRDRARKGRSSRGEHRPSAKLTEGQVLEIRARLELGESQQVIADDLGVQQAQISRIKRRVKWAHI